MGRMFCGVPFRINALTMLYMNFAWNIYVVGAYLFAFNDSEGSKISHVGNGFTMIMTFLSMISMVYVGAIITLHKKEFYMLLPAIVALILDASCLMYFYSELISVDLMITWQKIIDQMIMNVESEILRNLIEQSVMTLLRIVLSVPLSFKILSALILRWYRIQLKKKSSVLMFPPFADAILHFPPPPPYTPRDVFISKEDIPDCPLPPYSKYSIETSRVCLA